MAKTRYSFSRISTFEQCARRFRYRYLDGVKEAFRGIEAFMGRQVHSTVEWLFAERGSGRERSSEEAVGHYCDAWDREAAAGTVPLRVVKQGEDLLSYHRSGADMVASFHAQRFATDRLETIANEKHFVIRVGGRYVVQGFIDRVARDEAGRLHLIDYKTGKQRSKTFEGKEAEQLHTYSLALFAETDADEMQLSIEYLRTGRTVSQNVRRSEAVRIEKALAARIAAVEASTVFPPTPGVLCRWCGYNDICDASGMGQRALALGGLD